MNSPTEAPDVGDLIAKAERVLAGTESGDEIHVRSGQDSYMTRSRQSAVEWLRHRC